MYMTVIYIDMCPKRNPISKRVHDSDSGKFLPEDSINSLTPFGYNDSDEGSGYGGLLLLLAIVCLIGYAHTQGMLPVFF